MLTFLNVFSPESMVDLVYLLNELVDSSGKILVPGVYDSVKPLTDEEKKLYEQIDFSQVGVFLLKLNYFKRMLTKN